MTRSPITITLREQTGFASFTHRRHQGNRIGYRFFEHTPLTYGDVPTDPQQAGIDEVRGAGLLETFAQRPDVGTIQRTIIEQTDWIDQVWTFHIAPTLDGLDLLWLIDTYRQGLPRYYGVQQCFRLGGLHNAAWRREIAEAPAFSEYDLWVEEQGAPTKSSLTYVPRTGVWQPLPATEECVGARTPLGVQIDRARFGGKMPERVGPYRARMLEPVDSGLVTRTDRASSWLCGIFWERTSHVTDHHPADCLHAIVDIGNVPPYSRRTVRGKIFWFRGDKRALLERWRRDFGALGAG